MGTYTTNYNLYMPTVGEQGWGTLVNTNFTTIDTAMDSMHDDIDTLFLTIPVINTVTLTTPIAANTSIFAVNNNHTVIGISFTATSGTSEHYLDVSIVDDTDTELLEPFDLVPNKTGHVSGSSKSYSNFSGSNKNLYITSNIITWVVSTDIPLAKANASGFGLQSSCVAAGGSIRNGSIDYRTGDTYVFNGSTWSTSGNLNTIRFGCPACGLQSAGIVSSGESTDIVEKYNGSTWASEATRFPQNVTNGAAAGYQSSTIHYGGKGQINSQYTYKYDGSTWTMSGALTQTTYLHGGCGTASAAIAVGGNTWSGSAVPSAVCSLFNGSTWRISPSVDVAGVNSAFGKTVSSVISVGNYTNTIPKYYDGATWRVISSLNTPRTSPCTIGSKNFGFVYDGQTSSIKRTAVTEKTAHVISSGAFTVKIITT